MATFWIDQVMYWKRITLQFEHLCARINALGVVVKPGVRLPKELDMAVRACSTLVEGALQALVYNLTSPLRTMNTLHRQHRRADNGDGIEESNMDPNDPGDRVLWATRAFKRQVLTQDPYGLSSHVRLIEREMAKDNVPYNKDMQTALSSIAQLLEFRVSCRWNQMAFEGTPAPASEVYQYSKQRDLLQSDHYIRFQSNGKVEIPIIPSCLSPREEERRSKLLREFTELPVPSGSKDMKWLRKMAESRKRLAAFWQCSRGAYAKMQRGIKRDESYIQTMLGEMSFDISPEYQAEVGAERHQIEDRARRMKLEESQRLTEKTQHLAERMEEQRIAQKAKAKAHEKVQTTPFVQQTWDKMSAEDNVAHKPATSKTKAMRETIADAEPAMQNLTIQNKQHEDDGKPEDIEVVQIPVKKDTLSVMERLFPGSAGVGEKSVRWTALQQALEDAGMVSAANGGSKVTFANQQGCICFHSPHPEPTVDAIRLRSFGRRLTKWFGWTQETFILRSKVGVEVENNVKQPSADT